MSNFLGIIGKLHAVKQVALLERIVAFTKKIDILLAPHKAHVRNAADEIGGILQKTLLHQKRPELLRHLERFGDFYGLARVDDAIFVFGRIVQFAKGRVARASVIPGIGTFGSGTVQTFVYFDGKAGL